MLGELPTTRRGRWGGSNNRKTAGPPIGRPLWELQYFPEHVWLLASQLPPSFRHCSSAFFAAVNSPGALEYARAKDLKECCWPTDSQRKNKGALIWKGRAGPRLPVSYIGGATFRDAWQSRVAVRLAMKNQNTHASVTSQFANL